MLNLTHPKVKGERTEGVILAHLLRLGYTISLPFGNNQRYDMIIDDGDRLLKAQCKTGHIVNGCVAFSTCSRNSISITRKSYQGEVDIFLVYCPGNDKVYSVPISVTGETEFRMRIDPPRTKAATSKIKWAKDYEI